MAKLNFKSKSVENNLPAFVMGILNATPDSFYANSRGGLKRAFELIDAGADILDIGGESTRPGFEEVSVEEEINRVVPLIKEIRQKSQIVISVDTRKAEVARQAILAGADIINDVSSLGSDDKMIDVLKETDVPVIIMHGYGLPENNAFGQEKIVQVVKNFFTEKIEYLLMNGIDSKNIILDPGIGFGKSFEENIALIKNTDKFCDSEYPFLMALSRKRCIGQMTDTTVENRMTGTITADLFSVIKGAKILRVHDVKETVESLKVMKNLF